MTKSIRWRIIVLQTVMVLVLGFAAGGALYASNFIPTQIHQQLVPQHILSKMGGRPKSSAALR